jgi:hypothetical protein
MRLAIVLTATAVLGAFAAAAGTREPTKTGDTIGTITMRPDRSLHLRLRSVQCDGTLAEGEFDIKRTQANYQSTIDHVGGLKPNETKFVPAWPTPPCPNWNGSRFDQPIEPMTRATCATIPPLCPGRPAAACGPAERRAAVARFPRS